MGSNEWVSLRAAADILGVHPATVRNWADRGDLPARRTPGGHRRFRRSDLLKLAESGAVRPPDEVQLVLQNALGRARMEVGGLTDVAWYNAMSDATRATLREQGRKVLEAMRAYLGREDDDDQALAPAIALGEAYAVRLHADGLTLPQAVRGFFYYNDFVLNAILTWGELAPPRDPAGWAALLRRVNDFGHAMLLSIIEYYQED